MILLLPDAPIDDDIAHDLLEAKLRGSMVVDIRTFYEHVVQRLPLSQINDEWLLQTEGFSLNTRGSLRRLKRALDVLISLVLLIPATPVMLLTALIVRLESPGPVIYRQDRVGLYEKEFTVYKFRSMRADAEKNGAVWASAHDNRVTRFGKFIRKVRIDELPQIWNILKGDMSFIGPRPERMAFVKQLKKDIPYYSLRHTVKPGLTGWAQVCYPYGASEEDAAASWNTISTTSKTCPFCWTFTLFSKPSAWCSFPRARARGYRHEYFFGYLFEHRLLFRSREPFTALLRCLSCSRKAAYR